MATGHYECSSNSAVVADERVVRGLLRRYDTHNQASLRSGRLSINSPSDSLNVSLGGSGAEIEFLKDIAPHLADKLRIRNVIDYPYDDTRVITYVVKPNGSVLMKEDGETTEL